MDIRIRHFLDRSEPIFSSVLLLQNNGESKARESTAFKQTQILTQIIIQVLSDTSACEVGKKLIPIIQSGEINFAEAFSKLPDSSQDKISDSIGQGALNELLALSEETNSKIFASLLFQYGQRREMQNQYLIAAAAYSAVSYLQNSPALTEKAEERLEVFQGKGSAGLRIEFLGRQWLRQSLDPAMLFGMGMATGAAETLRLATYSRLIASPSASFWTQGFGAKLLSWGAGFAADFPTFTFASRLTHEAMGLHQDWSRNALGSDLFENGLGLFSVKAMGAIAGNTHLLPHFASLTGLMGMRALEIYFGHKKPVSASNILVDSIALLTQAHVGGKILHNATGGFFETSIKNIESRLDNSRNNGSSTPNDGAGVIDSLTRFLKIPKIQKWVILPADAISLPTIIFTMGSGRRVAPKEQNSPLILDAEQRNIILKKLDDVGESIFRLYGRYKKSPNWVEETEVITKRLIESAEHLKEVLPASNDSNHSDLHEILKDLRLISALLQRIRRPESNGTDMAWDTFHQKTEIFLGHLYRCPNRLTNFLQDNATLSVTLEASNLARNTAADFFKTEKVSR
jgi:hypothetical protein